jgi:hypothetical protein
MDAPEVAISASNDLASVEASPGFDRTDFPTTTSQQAKRFQQKRMPISSRVDRPGQPDLACSIADPSSGQV